MSNTIDKLNIRQADGSFQTEPTPIGTSAEYVKVNDTDSNLEIILQQFDTRLNLIEQKVGSLPENSDSSDTSGTLESATDLSLEQVIIKLANGNYKGPVPFKTSSKNITHSGYTLESLIGVGWNPFEEGDLTSLLDYLKNSVSEIFLEQIQQNGIGKMFITQDVLLSDIITINTDEVTIEKNDPYSEINITDLIMSEPSGCLFIVTGIDTTTNESGNPIYTVHHITTIVTSIQGVLLDGVGQPNLNENGEPIYSERYGSIKLSKWDVGLGKLDNTEYLRLDGGVGSSKSQTVKGNIIVEGNLTVQGDNTIIESETLKVSDNLIETNSNKTTLTYLSGLAINKNSTQAYGICYDPSDDSVKLGLGSINSAGIFSYASNEGHSIVLRSTDLENGKLVKWDATSHYLENAGALAKRIPFTSSNFSSGQYTVNIGSNYMPVGVYKYTSGTISYVLINSVDVYKEGNNARIVTNEDEVFNGFILVVQEI